MKNREQFETVEVYVVIENGQIVNYTHESSLGLMLYTVCSKADEESKKSIIASINYDYALIVDAFGNRIDYKSFFESEMVRRYAAPEISYDDSVLNGVVKASVKFFKNEYADKPLHFGRNIAEVWPI